ncbi:MAG: MFS transporter [Bacillota bacterium]
MSNQKHTGAMLIACISFLALGMVTAALGPALPDLAARTGSSLAAVGSLFTAIFLGALLSLSAAGAITDRFGQAPVLLAGALLTGLSTVAFTLTTSLPAMLALAMLTGVGHGAVDIAATILIARLFAERTVSALNLLNVFFGAGAIAGPAAASLTMRLWGTGLSGLWLGAGLMFLTALLVPLLPRRAGAPATVSAASGARAVLRSPLAWSFGLLLLLYVGAEQGVSGWATAYMSQTTTLDQAQAALITSAFWLALTAGRLLAAALGYRLSPDRLLRLFLAGAAAGAVALPLSTGSTLFSVAAILLLGLSFGPIFPTAVGIVTLRFPQAPGTAGSLVIALGCIGGALLPWTQGALMVGAGPRASVSLVAAGALAMLLLQRLISQKSA